MADGQWTSPTGFIFRASWPIVDDTYTRSQLAVEACASIDEIARESLARITGDITWTISADGGRLIAEAEAEPVVAVDGGRVEWGTLRRQAEAIERMRAAGKTFPEIARVLGCRPDSVKHAYYRERRAAA